MAYGVDECRVCGKPIKPTGPEAMQRYERSLRATPTMTEKEWRAAGLKAAPTKRQMVDTQQGCCYDCALKMGLKSMRQPLLIYPALIIAALFIVLMFYIGSRT